MRRIRARDLPAAAVGLGVVIATAVGLATFAIGRWSGDLTTPLLAIGLVSLRLATFRIDRTARASRLARVAHALYLHDSRRLGRSV